MRVFFLLSLAVLGFTSCAPFIANKPIEERTVYLKSNTLTEERKLKLWRERMREELRKEVLQEQEEEKESLESSDPILSQNPF